jgi:hypothetical protein
MENINLHNWLTKTLHLDESGSFAESDLEFQKLAEYNAPRTGKKKKRWSSKYKKSINCNNPKGFSQKQYCKRKNRGGGYKTEG